MSHSTNRKFSGDDADAAQVLYDKLFHGNNIPAYMKTDFVYVPDWRADEIEILSQIMMEGVEIIKDALRIPYASVGAYFPK